MTASTPSTIILLFCWCMLIKINVNIQQSIVNYIDTSLTV